MFKFKYLALLMVVMGALTVTTTAIAWTRSDVNLICTIIQIVKNIPCTDAQRDLLLSLAEPDPTFTHQRNIQITSPSGGEVFRFGQLMHIVAWANTSVGGDYYDFYIRGVDSRNAYTVASNVFIATDGDNKVSTAWTPHVGNYGSDTKFLAGVCARKAGICDENDSYFTIISPPDTLVAYLKINSPYEGEVLKSGTKKRIEWSWDTGAFRGRPFTIYLTPRWWSSTNPQVVIASEVVGMSYYDWEVGRAVGNRAIIDQDYSISICADSRYDQKRVCSQSNYFAISSASA